MVDRFQARGVLLPLGIFLAAIALSFVFPPLTMIMGMLVPVPLILVNLRRGKIPGLITITGVALVLWFLVGPQGAISFVAAYGIVAATMAETTRMSFSFEKIILFSALAPSVLALVILFAGGAGDGESSLANMEEALKKASENYIQALEQTGAPPEDLEVFRKSVEEWAPMWVRVLPAMVLSGFLIAAVVNFLVVRFLWLKYYSRKYFEGMNVSRWMLPDAMIWVLIASLGSLFLASGFSQTVGMNLTIIILILYFLQGLSIVTHILKAKAFPKWVWAVVFILIPLNPMFTGLVVGIGLFDIWLDFRKIRVTAPPASGDSMQ